MRRAWSWGHEDVGVGDEERFIVGNHGWGGRGVDGCEVLIEEYDPLNNCLFSGMSINEYESLYRPRWGIKDIGHTISCLGIPPEGLDGLLEDGCSFGGFFFFCESHHRPLEI